MRVTYEVTARQEGSEFRVEVERVAPDTSLLCIGHGFGVVEAWANAVREVAAHADDPWERRQLEALESAMRDGLLR